MRPRAAMTILFGLGVLTSGCRATGAAPEGQLPVEVERVEMLQLESFPVQYVLQVEGWLPNPCSSADWEIAETAAAETDIALFAVPDGSEACIQVLAPFTVNIPLGPLPPDTRILLNGEPVASP
jgi:hypothetical protein